MRWWRRRELVPLRRAEGAACATELRRSTQKNSEHSSGIFLVEAAEVESKVSEFSNLLIARDF